MKGLPPGWQADIISGLGGQHTAGAEHLLGAWQQWEGGSTANGADYNPLNTTIGGYQKMNSVGVSVFPDWQTGVKETINTLKAYPALTEALRTGKIDFSNPALQADLNYWLTGKRTPGMTPYVSKIARSYGQDVPLSETRATTNTAPTAPVPPPVQAAAPAKKPISLMDIALGKRSIMDMFFQKRPRADAPARPTLPAFTAQDAVTGANAAGWTTMPTTPEWTRLGTPAPPDAQAPASPNTPLGVPPTKGTATVLAIANKALGTPYVWGGASPGHFDCSGLLSYAYGQIGVKLPHGSVAQYGLGQAVPTKSLRPGDAVFFEWGNYDAGTGPGHVGIYIGNDKFIEAPHTGADVRISTLSTRGDYVGARRFG